MIKKLLMTMCLSASLFAMGGPSLVEVTKLKKGEVNPLQEFIGTITFDKQSVLAAQNSGIVKTIKFEVGEKIKSGKTLVQIDADLLNAQIKAARANLNSAKASQKNAIKDYERYRKLISSKSITQKEYDDAVLKLDSANSNVKALEAKLAELSIQSDKKRVKAPFSGTIVEKNVDLGEWVNAGSPIATLVDTSVAKVVFNVPLNVVNGLNKGDAYNLIINNNEVKSKLSAVIPNGDKLTRTFPVEFKADVSKLFVFNGQEAKVSLSKNGKSQAFILPRDAVIKRFGQNVIFSVTPKNTAAMIPVEIVAYLDSQIAVNAKGLVEGMTIVKKGNERVFPNSAVKIINK